MKIFFLLGLFLPSIAWTSGINTEPGEAHDHSHSGMHSHDHSSHEGHLHETLVDGKELEVDPERFDKFIEGLADSQIAVVSVNGMVCDFCARGIEKTFKKDKSVKRVDVDLSRGKVLVAYNNRKVIDFEEIKLKIVSNGQNATDLQILDI
ncbi:MAG: heavy-metal-associated domain-containing protein [SAR86 cluster bacterium]|uniref:Heavy-metal-associated domain-containing protein n=1 Tax=SAR86 cluster bacterium TaxID=2030880 RepID=A0A368BVX4_9GAMM|nr:MAG: heavy-metal-associated domain-containing protein [SAR86 cluster bacterium]